MQKEFQKIMQLLHDETGTVGGVFAVFEDGKVTFIDKYGMADVEEGREVTLNCSFDIASCSKAWTVMLCAQAIDEGLIGWDQPIKDIIPEFTMMDKYAGEHLSIRDMASHRSGLPCHDFLRDKIGGSRENMMLKCATLPPNVGFRTTYQYNNHMFILLGYLLERIYGKTWEELIVEKIAKPLGVETIRLRGIPGNMDNLERALPYVGNGFVAHRCGYADSPISGPCGGIKINLPDLLKWVMAMARGGVCESGERLCSEEQYKQIIEPVIPSTEENGHGISGSCYAQAWHTGVYNNEPFVFHSGGLTGFNTQVGFFPGQNKGYAMIFNTGSTPASETMRRMALDYLTSGTVSEENCLECINDWKARRDRMLAGISNATGGAPVTAETDPKLAGVYEHPAYETFDIAEKDGQLWFFYGGFEAGLTRGKDTDLICGYSGVLDGLVPDHIELKYTDDGLLLHTMENDLWMPFKRIK
ncbi:MAG: serine hydrolase [Clostridia bacterium]|nr:serine hydrolase [Clostridia bacterium]